MQETPESDSGAAWLKQVVTNRKWFTYAELYKYLLAEEEEEALSRCFRKWKPWMWVLNKKWRWGESQLGRKLSHEVKQRRLDWLLTYQTELQHKELWLASSSWLWGVWPIRFLPAAALQEGLELNHWSSVKCAHLYLIIIFGLNTGKKTGSLVAQISELTSCPADKQSVGAGETGSGQVCYLSHHGVSAASADDKAERTEKTRGQPTCPTWTPEHLLRKSLLKTNSWSEIIICWDEPAAVRRNHSKTLTAALLTIFSSFLQSRSTWRPSF